MFVLWVCHHLHGLLYNKLSSSSTNNDNRICIIGRRRRIERLRGLIVERRQRIRALDDPIECKEEDTTKSGGAPSMRVPFAVLSNGERSRSVAGLGFTASGGFGYRAF
ncbi:hypothetical protein CFP56_003186 [Quercus suber]|uniref:Uncharacterized protein n=1 Tax=Quercus suber TaxID=58331 RepID=A0AAW0IJ84_QUESU